jgi:hypothetical protein
VRILFVILLALSLLGCAWDKNSGFYNPHEKKTAVFTMEENEAYVNSGLTLDEWLELHPENRVSK